MGNILPGKKTYILVILGLVITIATYASGITQNGFSWPDFMKFIQSDALIASIGTLRMAIK